MKLLVMSLISLMLSLNAAQAVNKCTSFLTTEKSYTAPSLDLEALQSLVGSKISYTGKYNYHDSSDRRKIQGSGIVYRVAYWGKDSNKSFSLLYLNEKGELRHTQIFTEDPSFRLTVGTPSALAGLIKEFREKNLSFTYAEFHNDTLSLAARLRHLNINKMIVTYIDKADFSVRHFDAKEIIIPTDHDIIVKPLDGGPAAKFEFRNGDKSIALDAKDIIGYVL